MQNFKLSRKAFKRWLETQDPDTYVGTTCQADCCPISHWLKENGAVRPRVGIVSFRTGEQIKRRLPEWARRFVASIDTAKTGTKPPYCDIPFDVQAGQALAHLNQVEADLAARR